MTRKTIDGIVYLDLSAHEEILAPLEAWSRGPACPVHNLVVSKILRMTDRESVYAVVSKALADLGEALFVMRDGTEDSAALAALNADYHALEELQCLLDETA